MPFLHARDKFTEDSVPPSTTSTDKGSEPKHEKRTLRQDESDARYRAHTYKTQSVQSKGNMYKNTSDV